MSNARLDNILNLVRTDSPAVARFSLCRFIEPATDDTLIQLAAAIKTNTNIKIFEIEMDEKTPLLWTEAGMTALGAAIKNHPKITSLDIIIARETQTLNSQILSLLSQTLVGESKIESLSFLIKTPELNLLNALNPILQQNTSLNDLAFCLDPDRETQEPFPPTDWELFAASLANKNIISFTLISARLTDVGLTAITNVLSKKNNLENLNLIDCGLTPQNIGAVNNILRTNPKIEGLDLSDNALSSRGMGVLAPELAKLQNLRILYLSNTQLNGQAYKILLIILRQLKVLRLNLSNNVLDDFTFDSLGHIIEEISSLEEIIFQSSHFGFGHLRFLYPVLSNHRVCKLRAFTIDFNEAYLTHAIANEILESNPRLEGFDRLESMPPYSDKKHLIRQRFIDYAILLAFAIGPAESTGMNIRRLPFELKIIILNYVVSKFMGIEPKIMTACWKLLLQNCVLHNWSQLTRAETPLRLFQKKKPLTEKLETEGLDKASTEVLADELSGLSPTWINKRI